MEAARGQSFYIGLDSKPAKVFVIVCRLFTEATIEVTATARMCCVQVFLLTSLQTAGVRALDRSPLVDAPARRNRFGNFRCYAHWLNG